MSAEELLLFEISACVLAVLLEKSRLLGERGSDRRRNDPSMLEASFLLVDLLEELVVVVVAKEAASSCPLALRATRAEELIFFLVV